MDVFFFGMGFWEEGARILAPSPDCYVEAGAGNRARLRFARCVDDLKKVCDGAWVYDDKDGNSHADGYNGSISDPDSLEACDFPDEDG